MASNVPNVAPAVYAQTGPYNPQIPFGQPPPRAQPSPTNLSASHPMGSVSSPFPVVSLQPSNPAAAGLSPHSQLPTNFAATGSITNSILPPSVVDDSQSVPFPGAAAAAEALHNSYPWTDSGLGSQPMASGALAQRMHYGGQIQQHMRQQQSNGLITPRMAGNTRGDGDNSVANGAVMHSAGFHSQQVNAVGSVLTHVSVGGAFSGMSPLTQGTNQGLMPLMGTPSSYSEGEGSTGRHTFQSAQLDMMGGPPLRPNVMAKAPGAMQNRTPYEGGVGAFMRNSPLMSAPDLSPAAFGAAAAAAAAAAAPPPPQPPPGPQNAPISAPNGGNVKAEDSSGPLSRSMKPPRSRSTRSRRKSQPPGTPCVPVHLRNPKKGRDRVFRKCQVCNHDNHIRRSNCDSCKQPLPAGKRKRDGSMSFSKTSQQKQQQTQSSAQTKAASAAYKTQPPPQPSPVVITSSARHTVTPLAPAHPTLSLSNGAVPATTGGMDSASSAGTASGAGAASSLASPEGARAN